MTRHIKKKKEKTPYWLKLSTKKYDPHVIQISEKEKIRKYYTQLPVKKDNNMTQKYSKLLKKIILKIYNSIDKKWIVEPSEKKKTNKNWSGPLDGVFTSYTNKNSKSQ